MNAVMSTPETSQIDPAMLELFQAEMDTHIPVLDQGLLALEKNQAGAREIEAMMRAAHSIKGAARIVGIEPAVRVSHVMEDCFTAAKEARIALNSDAVDVLLQGVDALQRICSPAGGATIREASLAELLARLTSLKNGEPAAPAAATEPTPAAVWGSAQLVAATVHRDEPGITLPAVFDDASIASLRREMLDTLALGPRRIHFDFMQVDQLSAGGLAILASFAREAARAQPTPKIEAHGTLPAVQSVLRVAGLDGILGMER
jgi:two-component system sensor histidine kinase and response regulator WspE